MPTKMIARISNKIQNLKNAARKECAAYLKDVGRFGREQWRANLPRRSGQARTSVKLGEVQETAKTLYIEIGSSMPRVRWLEQGTGLYGPRKQRIRPVHAKALAWQTGGARMYGVKGGRIGPGYSNTVKIASGIAIRGGKVIKSPKRDTYMQFARSVRGIRPLHAGEKALKGSEMRTYRRQRLAQLKAGIAAAAKKA